MAIRPDAPPVKTRIRDFWEGRPCGAVHGEGFEGSHQWYAAVEKSRQELEPFISDFAAFDTASGQDVLEIGVGLGTDLVRFARAGARVTGVDLSERAVALTRRRLEMEGFEGGVRVADAEALPFPASSFDVVYSWGVLHHTPDTARAIREAIRVLRGGGRLVIMIYARHSWVAWALWTRHALLRGRPWRSVGDVLANHLESAGTQAFTFSEIREMLTGTVDLQLQRVVTPYDRRVAGPLAHVVGGRLGWFIVARARVPSR